jgi:putative DNA primase/helicase
MSALPNFKRIAAAAAKLDAAIASTPVVAVPRPLPPELLPVEPFPIVALPEPFRPWVEDVCDRMQLPPDFVGVPLLVGAASLAARHVAIRPRQRDDWTETGNLWALIVGRPGVHRVSTVPSSASTTGECIRMLLS